MLHEQQLKAEEDLKKYKELTRTEKAIKKGDEALVADAEWKETHWHLAKHEYPKIGAKFFENWEKKNQLKVISDLGTKELECVRVYY